MKLGLVTDIHEYADNLRRALDEFARVEVDQVVVLGDLTCLGDELEPICQLLQEARAIGVWGNHDLGLCLDPEPALVARFPRVVLDFMGTLRPRLSLGDCHFSHVEPWLDPTDPAQINYFEGPADTSS